jgi:hypothetical protein
MATNPSWLTDFGTEPLPFVSPQPANAPLQLVAQSGAPPPFPSDNSPAPPTLESGGKRSPSVF